MASVQSQRTIPQHVLLTGIPGVGKTTLVKKIHQELTKRDLKCCGFITEEVRSGGRRIGFDIMTTDGLREPLARISQSSREFQPSQQREYKVGQYSVNVLSFEQVALNLLTGKHSSSSSVLSTPRNVFLIDEIGKMELFSHKFMQSVRSLISQASTTVIATIPVPKGRPIPFVEEVRNGPQSKVFEVTRENRDHILNDILETVYLSIGLDGNKDR